MMVVLNKFTPTTDTPTELFGQLYKSHFRRLYVHAFSILRNETWAREAVQQVFLRLWEKQQLLSGDKALNAYLYKAVSNESINRLKQQSRIRRHQYQDGQPADTHVRAGETSELKELEQTIAAVLQELPEKRRLVFQLSRYEELSYAEIATQLGVSVKAVEKHITLALKLFRKRLKHYLPLLFLIV